MITKKIIPALIILAVLTFVSCNPVEKDSKSASFIIIESIMGTDAAGNEANVLESDVLDANSTIRADYASATLRASLLDPDPIIGTSQFEDIMLDRYIVSYSRSDGKNREGVDVPYSFEASLSQRLKIGTSTTLSIVVVRAVAKAEPPLVALAQNRAEGVLEVTAKIEFYGHDLADRRVRAEGYLTIFFANYAED
jgi:hypothetical protein